MGEIFRFSEIKELKTKMGRGAWPPLRADPVSASGLSRLHLRRCLPNHRCPSTAARRLDLQIYRQPREPSRRRPTPTCRRAAARSRILALLSSFSDLPQPSRPTHRRLAAHAVPAAATEIWRNLEAEQRWLGPHAYTASKHAIIGLTKNTACELGKYGIRINCISSFGVATAMLVKAWRTEEEDGGPGVSAVEVEKPEEMVLDGWSFTLL